MATLVNYTHYRLIKLTSGFLVNLVSACEEQSVLCEKSKRAAKMRCQGWRKGRLVISPPRVEERKTCNGHL